MAGTQEKILKKMAEQRLCPPKKVTIVGMGQVGQACALALVMKNAVNEIVLVDEHASELEAELLDLQYGSVFYNNVSVSGSTGYEMTAHSKICIITAGYTPKSEDTRLDEIKRNINILQQVIPQFLKYSPDAIIIVVTNPVDVMTHAAWKISKLPQHRVLGTGTSMDTSRFRVLLSQRLKVSPLSIHGWIIGAHGDTCVPVWSGVEVASVRLRELNPDVATSQDRENWMDIYQQVLDSSSEMVRLKGYSSWGCAASIRSLVDCILSNGNRTYSISTRAKGYHGITEDVFLSLPCVLGESGITDVMTMTLSEEETSQLRASAAVLHKERLDGGF